MDEKHQELLITIKVQLEQLTKRFDSWIIETTQRITSLEKESLKKEEANKLLLDADKTHKELWESVKATEETVENLIQFKSTIKGGLIILGLIEPVLISLIIYWITK